MIGSMRNTRGDDIRRANTCGNRLTVPEAGFRGRAPRVVFCPSKAHRLTVHRVERNGWKRSLFGTVQAFIHREIQCFFETGLQGLVSGLQGRVWDGFWVGGTGDDHDDRHRSNDSGQRAESASQPEAGKLPDRGGLAGSRRRLGPPGGPVRPADDAAVEGIPGAVENKGTGIRGLLPGRENGISDRRDRKGPKKGFFYSF